MIIVMYRKEGDKMELKLTKEQAIMEHRKMWNWIAEQYRNGCTLSVMSLKKAYTNGLKYEYGICNNCFCCEYATQQLKEIGYFGYECRCVCCPLDWKSNMRDYPCIDRYEEDDEKGLYEDLCQLCLSMLSSKVHNKNETNVLATLAEEIANLPERE